MALVTIQIIQGHEAGVVLRDLETPVTIGREEENEVQLNDERISRFHAKIQGNDEALILTDLDSTNGTRVNGHYTKMRLLRKGDQIAVGRCLLVVGAPEELLAGSFSPTDAGEEAFAAGEEMDPAQPAFPEGPPASPQGLSALQSAQVASVIEFARTEILAALNLIDSRPREESEAADETSPEAILLPREAWHRLQLVPGILSRYLDELVNPASDQNP